MEKKDKPGTGLWAGYLAAFLIGIGVGANAFRPSSRGSAVHKAGDSIRMRGTYENLPAKITENVDRSALRTITLYESGADLDRPNSRYLRAEDRENDGVFDFIEASHGTPRDSPLRTLLYVDKLEAAYKSVRENGVQE